MSREGKFMVHCVECYRHDKRLTGVAVEELFSKHGVFEYIMECFESLHVNGDRYLIEEIDEYIAADQAHTRKWMREQAPLCHVVVSQYVVEESLKGREDLVRRRMEFLANQELIKFDAKTVSALASKLIAAHALPPKETTDALHIAAASVCGSDYLLTWNCCHMANPHTLPKTIQIVEKAGFRCPQIMTPQTFLENLTLGKRK